MSYYENSLCFKKKTDRRKLWEKDRKKEEKNHASKMEET